MSDTAHVESGHAWLGRIPAHWELKRLGYFFTERKETVSDQDFAPLSVTKDGIVPRLETAAKTDNGDNRKKVCQGDFVINSRSDRKGSSGVSLLTGSVSVISTVLTPRDIDPRFVHYLLRSVPFQEEYYRFGSGIVADLWSTRYTAMKQIMLAVPPLNEQQEVADFLDRESAQIDHLIEKQERLIDVLGERRAALRTHAFPSITEGTTQIRLRYLYSPSDVSNRAEAQVLSVYRDFGVIPKASRNDNRNVTPENLDRYLFVGNGDLVVNKMKAWQGSLGVSRCEGIVSPDYEVLKQISSDLMPEFAHHFLRSPRMIFEYRSRSVGIRPSQWRLYWNQLSEVRVPVLPVEEQRSIVANLTIELTKIDTLVEKAKAMNVVLRERRSALISAAVTGKIDVTKRVEGAA